MKGKIIQVMGPVVDVEFDGYLPEINEAIDVSGIASGKDRLVLEEINAERKRRSINSYTDKQTLVKEGYAKMRQQLNKNYNTRFINV